MLYGGETIDETTVSYTCLEHDDECDLTTKANKYTIVLCESVTAPCEDQASITISSTEYDCTSTASTSNNGQIGGSVLPILTLTDNSPYIDGAININALLSGTCGTPPPYNRSTATVQAGGCTSGGCSNDYLGTYKFSINSSGSHASTIYVKEMKIYTTDSFGTLSTSHTLDLDPATSPYYIDDITDCPGCATVLASEVQIGDPNFTAAFETLMDNVSLALFGSTGLHYLTATGGTSSYHIYCTALHNPSGNWFGLHTPDIRVVMSDNTVHTSANNFSNFSTPIRFYYDAVTFWDPNTWPSSIFLLDCLEHTPVIGDQLSYASINKANSSFNKITLLSNLGTNGILVTSDVTTNCTPTTLSATYTTSGTVSGVSWQDPSSVEISTTSTATVDDPGTYTFTVTLENGCAISETILVD